MVDNHNQSVMGGLFLWVKHANSYLEYCKIDSDGNQIVDGWHDGYHPLGITHRQKISLLSHSHEMCILDLIDGTGVHELAVYFHFAPTARVHPSATAGR